MGETFESRTSTRLILRVRGHEKTVEQKIPLVKNIGKRKAFLFSVCMSVFEVNRSSNNAGVL